MTAKTFTISNTGSSPAEITAITFGTPTGIKHTADLSNLGGSSSFTGGTATISKIINAGASATFSVDHSNLAATTGTKTGTIQITGKNGASATINTTINVGTSVLAPAVVSTPRPVAVGQSGSLTFTNCPTGKISWTGTKTSASGATSTIPYFEAEISNSTSETFGNLVFRNAADEGVYNYVFTLSDGKTLPYQITVTAGTPVPYIESIPNPVAVGQSGELILHNFPTGASSFTSRKVNGVIRDDAFPFTISNSTSQTFGNLVFRDAADEGTYNYVFTLSDGRTVPHQITVTAGTPVPYVEAIPNPMTVGQTGELVVHNFPEGKHSFTSTKNGVIVNNNSEFTIINPTSQTFGNLTFQNAADAGTYDYVFSLKNSNGTTAKTINYQIVVNATYNPVFVYPASVQAGTTTFNVTLSGAKPGAVSWTVNGANLQNGTVGVSGAAAFTGLTLATAGTYTYAFTFADGQTRTFTITATPAATGPITVTMSPTNPVRGQAVQITVTGGAANKNRSFSLNGTAIGTTAASNGLSGLSLDGNGNYTNSAFVAIPTAQAGWETASKFSYAFTFPATATLPAVTTTVALTSPTIISSPRPVAVGQAGSLKLINCLVSTANPTVSWTGTVTYKGGGSGTGVIPYFQATLKNPPPEENGTAETFTNLVFRNAADEGIYNYVFTLADGRKINYTITVDAGTPVPYIEGPASIATNVASDLVIHNFTAGQDLFYQVYYGSEKVQDNSFQVQNGVAQTISNLKWATGTRPGLYKYTFTQGAKVALYEVTVSAGVGTTQTVIPSTSSPARDANVTFTISGAIPGSSFSYKGTPTFTGAGYAIEGSGTINKDSAAVITFKPIPSNQWTNDTNFTYVFTFYNNVQVNVNLTSTTGTVAVAPYIENPAQAQVGVPTYLTLRKWPAGTTNIKAWRNSNKPQGGEFENFDAPVGTPAQIAAAGSIVETQTFSNLVFRNYKDRGFIYYTFTTPTGIQVNDVVEVLDGYPVTYVETRVGGVGDTGGVIGPVDGKVYATVGQTVRFYINNFYVHVLPEGETYSNRNWFVSNRAGTAEEKVFFNVDYGLTSTTTVTDPSYFTFPDQIIPPAFRNSQTDYVFTSTSPGQATRTFSFSIIVGP